MWSSVLRFFHSICVQCIKIFLDKRRNKKKKKIRKNNKNKKTEVKFKVKSNSEDLNLWMLSDYFGVRYRCFDVWGVNGNGNGTSGFSTILNVENHLENFFDSILWKIFTVDMDPDRDFGHF